MPETLQTRLSAWARRRPRHGLARAVFWLAAWFLLVSALRWMPGILGGLAAGLQLLLGIVLVMLAVPLLWTFVRRRLLWSLRNKLVLTYILFGLAPVVMLVILTAVTAYIAAGQFAIHLVDARVQEELNEMSAENSVREGQLRSSVEGRDLRETANAEMPGMDVSLPPWMMERRQRLRRTTSSFVDSASIFRGQANTHLPLSLTPWATAVHTSRFRGLVADNGEIYLVALNQRPLRDGRMFSLVTSEPVEGPMAQVLAEGLGVVRLLPPEKQQEEEESRADTAPTGKRQRSRRPNLVAIRGGAEPPAINAADIRVRFLSTLAMTDWAEGKADNLIVEVDSRPSVLYRQLFGASLSGWVMTVLRASLILLTILFAAIEVIAFLMAVRLTRTMTQSVADLYDATQHVDRGDLGHRIAVKHHDQLGELSHSFNIMTNSLERLLVEQKEKERLQNELSIAQQVQANLFPQGSCGLPQLELHGVCRPARSVSGDYYDFLVFQEDIPSTNGHSRPTKRDAGLGLAIGDISGKGISAALLMANLHSAVRAYQFAGEEVVYTTSTLEGLTASKEGRADAGGWFQSPGRIMSLLNRHLFRSTQPEKYATLFLAHYDAATCALTYSNAGQLPPFVLGCDGSVQRLEAGGPVVGLMDGMHFDEGRLTMRPGDILIAYSDGVTEPENDFGDFGEARLLEVVQRYRNQPLEFISSQVMLALDAWIGAEEQPDDITLVLARQV